MKGAEGATRWVQNQVYVEESLFEETVEGWVSSSRRWRDGAETGHREWVKFHPGTLPKGGG